MLILEWISSKQREGILIINSNLPGKEAKMSVSTPKYTEEKNAAMGSNADLLNPIDGSEDQSKADADSFAALLEEYLPQEPKRGKVMQGELLRIGRQGILVDIGAKRDAVVPQQELSSLGEDFISTLAVGLQLPVVVTHTPNGVDRLEVSIRRGLEEQDWTRAAELLESGEIAELPVTGMNKGGLLVEFGRLTGFIPNSHVPALKYVHGNEELQKHKEEMIGSKLVGKVIEIDHQRRRLVWSVKEAEQEQRERRLHELESGTVTTGRVENITDFGAFVDIGGVTGLVHISKIDWRHVNHPSEVLAIGDEVQVLVEAVDTKRGRIRLNRQAAMPNPWQLLPEVHNVGDLVEGVVTNVTDFGVFVRIPLGIEGLVHNSELHPAQQTARTAEGEEVAAFRIINSGEYVVARIISIEPERKRLGLSLSQVAAAEEAAWIAKNQPESAANSDSDPVDPEPAADADDALPETDLTEAEA